MSINIAVHDEQIAVNIVKGDVNLGKPPIVAEISITKDGIYTPNEGVDGFSKVDVFVLPTDMLDGLEDGWDVMFYDEHKRGLASYSIKQGHAINPPVYNCKNWQNADKEVIAFPYTPTGDVIFYALNLSYADQLYEFYGVDKAIYPYLLIAHPGTNTNSSHHININIMFAKSIFCDTTYIEFKDCLTGSNTSFGVDDWSDEVNTFVSQVMERISSVSTRDYNYIYFSTSEQNYNAKAYLNFDVSYTQRTLYRLDE